MAREVTAKIYIIPGSHPCEAVVRAAEHKGIPFKKIALVPPMHRVQMFLMFGDRTVPAIKINGEKVQTSRRIMRTLESIQPERPLFPADPGLRERVIAAEDWADDELQAVIRRIIWALLTRRPQAMLSFGRGEKLPVPAFLQSSLAGPAAMMSARLNHVTDAQSEADLARLPALLDQIDGYITSGVIGGGEPNVADFQIAAALALLMSSDDLRPAIESRPGGRLSRRLFAVSPGEISGNVLPDSWLEPLRAASSARASS